MYLTINFSAFRNAFERKDRGDQFSYNGLRALFDYLEEDSGLGERGYELDVVGLCCDWTEHASAAEAAEENGWSADEDADEEAAEDAALEWLHDHTTVIEFDGGVIIANF